MFGLFHRHRKKFKNPYPPIPHPNRDYRLKERIFHNTKKLLPLVKKSTAPRHLKKIIFQLNHAGYASLMLMKNEIFRLPNILNNNEEIRVASTGNLNGETELLILTNQRFLFIYYDLIKKQCHHLSMPLDQVVRAVYHHSVVETNTLTIGVNASQLDIRGVENAKEVAQKINYYLS